MKKRIAQDLSREYKPLRLWLDDLEEIEKILGTGSKFRTTSAEYDSVSELKSDLKEKAITELEIRCSDPIYARVEFGPVSARLYVSGSEETMSAGVFYSVDEIIKRRLRTIARILLHPLTQLAGINCAWDCKRFHKSILVSSGLGSAVRCMGVCSLSLPGQAAQCNQT